jgi:putative ABC transport system permease protein
MISIGMIVSTIISYQQFYFLSDKELGLNKEQVIAIRSIPPQVRSKYYTFKSELLRIPGVVDVSASMEEPSREIRDTGIIYAEGIQEGENTPVIDLQCIDQNYVDFMQIELVAGKTFSPTLMRNYKYPRIESTAEMVNYINSQQRVYLINEKAMKTIGWQSPSEALNRQFSWRNNLLQFQRGSIIGVVKNFHQESLRNKIDPLVLVYEPYFLHTFLIKIQSTNVGTILSQIEAKWRVLYPEHAFDFVFLDELFERLYLSEKRQTRILAFFTAVAIFIAFLGIFGLVTYSAERRRKELGIRKVLGASIPGIVLLLVRDFITYVVIAAILASPVAWYFMAKWLQNFAYHIEIPIAVFLIATALTLFTAIITVSFNAVKAALINPVDSLRYQ